MVVDPVLEIVCLGPQSNKLHVVSIVKIQDLLEHLVSIFYCFLQWLSAWICFLATLWAYFPHKCIIEHLYVVSPFWAYQTFKNLSHLFLFLVYNFELLLLLFFLFFNDFSLLVQAITVKQLLCSDGILFSCLGLNKGVVNMNGFFIRFLQIKWRILSF